MKVKEGSLYNFVVAYINEEIYTIASSLKCWLVETSTEEESFILVGDLNARVNEE
jgi:hypothetical protein